MERYQFVVRDDQSGMRIDQYLASMIPTLSRRKVRGILDVGGCYVNNKRMHIASRQVRGGDKVRVEYHLEALSKARQKIFELTAHDILFDDYNVIAINKPPGLPSQATRDQDVMHAEVCLRAWLKSKGRPAETLILCHRLDKETSGILLFTTLANTATWITEQFRQRQMNKTYWAISYGIPKHDSFFEECYLSDIDNKTGIVSVVRSGGKSSRTTFQVLKKNEDHRVCLIECHPETGRSHQIRVHLAHQGHGILGDKRYGLDQKKTLPESVGGEIAKHQMLHARAIQFAPAPGSADVHIEAPPPASFLQVTKLLF